MDVRKSTRLRKKPTVTYHPQNSHRNKRLKRSSPNEEEEEAVLLEEEDVNHQTQKRKPHSVEDKKPVVVSVSSRHHKIFHDLFGMMRYTKPYNQFLAYIQQNHVTNDDLQQILKLCDKKHGYNLIHQALSCYNISTNSTIDYNLVKLFLLLQVKNNNKNTKISSSSSAEEASAATNAAAAAAAAAAAKEALLVPTKDQRLTPLHIACCNIQKLVPKKIKILLDLDTTKSSLYHQSKNGVIPLHCLCSGIDVDGLKDTIQLLLQYDKTKKSLLIKNKLGQTPIDKVANEIGDVIIITNNNNKKKNKNDTKLSWLFPLLAEERIKVVKGTELWRNRLRIMLSQTLPPSSSSSQQKLSPPSRTQQHLSSTNGNNNNNSDDDSESETEDEDDIDDDDDDDSDDDDDDDESILEGVKTRLELKQQFQKLVKEFQYRANEYDQIYEGMLWLELAIWKGSFCGLQSLTKEERKNVG